MGAICGLIDKRKSKEQISAIVRLMIDKMAFRGADFKGVFAENGIGVGACVHKTVGNIKQPVTNEDGKILAVCDGEIYNYQEIRKNLLSYLSIFQNNRITRTNTKNIFYHCLWMRHTCSCKIKINGFG